MELAQQSGLQQGSARKRSSMRLQSTGLPVWRQPLLVWVQRLSALPVFSLQAFSLQQILLPAWLPVWRLRFSLQAWQLV